MDDARVKKSALSAVVLLLAILAGFSVGNAQGSPNHSTRGSGKIFRGDGGKTLAPFRVSGASTLFWANNGGIFQIFPSGGTLHGSVNSQGSKGWTFLPTGTYALQINAIGSWTLNIVPGAVRPTRMSGGLVGYAGNGGMELPPFRIPRSEQLYWQAQAGIFQVFSAGLSGANVNSQATKGSTYVSAGMQQLQVNTTGPWRIAWKP